MNLDMISEKATPKPTRVLHNPLTSKKLEPYYCSCNSRKSNVQAVEKTHEDFTAQMLLALQIDENNVRGTWSHSESGTAVVIVCLMR